ncbi:hypothetical protein BGZ83_005884 [Gryganskiella cystojenkinii]|nr:hypothetical protein BGZ83_005884 [Gryganskiella cystojenkinii]
MSVARIPSRTASSVASTKPAAILAQSIHCRSRNSGTVLDRWSLIAHTFRLSTHHPQPSAQLLSRRTVHSGNNSRTPGVSDATHNQPGQASKTLRPPSRNPSLRSPHSRQQSDRIKAVSGTLLSSRPPLSLPLRPEPDPLSIDSHTDYWRLYQDQLNNRLQPVSDAELLRVRQWLRIKGRHITKDEARKLDLILVEIRKRRLPNCYDSYNDLLYFYIKSQRYLKAAKCLDIITNAQPYLLSEQNARAQTLLMAMHLKSGDDAAFKAMFERDLNRATIYWEQVLQWTKGLQLRDGDYDRIKSALHAHQRKLCPPGSGLFTNLIGRINSEGRPIYAMRLFFHTLDVGFPADPYASSAVIVGLMKDDLYNEALQVWNRIGLQPELKSNLVILNPLLAGLCRSPRTMDLANDLWHRILQDPIIRPDAYTFSTMMSGYFRANQPESAMVLWKVMQGEPYNISLSVAICNAALTGLFNNMQPEKAKLVYADLIANKDLELSLDTYNIMLRGLLSVRDAEGVEGIFSRMREKGVESNTATYTIIADRLFSQRDPDGGLKVFELMSSNGIPMNAIAYSAAIAGLSKAGNLHQAKKVLEQMRTAEFLPTIHTYGSLIQGALKVGDVLFAEEIAEVAQTEIKEGLSDDTYTLLMGGYAHLLNMDRALYWLSEMRRTRQEAITWKSYYVLLQPCVEHQLWEPASKVVATMRELGYESRVPRLNRLVAEVDRINSGGPPRNARGPLAKKLASKPNRT